MTTTGFQVTLRTLSTSLASHLGISPMFDANVGSSSLAVLFDAVLYDDFYEYVSGNGYAYIKRKGTGLRVALRAEAADTSATVSFAALAAETALKHMNVQYHVRGVGLSETVVGTLLSVNLTGEFNTVVYQDLHRVISEAFPDYLEKPGMGHGEFAVPLPAFQDDPLERARSVHYAMSKVGQQLPLARALSDAPTTVSREIVLVIYGRMMGKVSSDSTDPPTSDQATRANKWLATGQME